MSILKYFSRTITKLNWRKLALAFVLFLIPVIMLVNIVDEVREGETLPYDEGILYFINKSASPLLDTVMVVLTQFGGVIGVACLGVLVCVALWNRGKAKIPGFLLASVGGALLLNLILKAFFQRDRPQLWGRLITENSYSFPSGHAMASSALAFSLIIIAWQTRWRYPVLVGALLYMLVIGYTRLYLGVHYPTDVLAGWAVSAVWVGIVAASVLYRHSLVKKLLNKKSY